MLEFTTGTPKRGGLRFFTTRLAPCLLALLVACEGGSEGPITPGPNGGIIAGGGSGNGTSGAAPTSGSGTPGGGDAGLPLPTGDAALTGDAAPDGPILDGSLCHLAGNQIGLMGDSYLHLSGDITRFVQEHARAAGALGADEVYLDHSLSGASMNGFPDIPSQWPDVLAHAERDGSDGVRVVIATGGGNDVLVTNRSCLDAPGESEITDECKQVVADTVATGEALFTQAAADGVEAVIYFFYPHLPDGSWTGFQGPHPNTVLDYAYPHVQKMCDEQVSPRCFFIDTRPALKGKQDTHISALDGIHPTVEGSQVIADLIWDVMQTRCIASE